MLPSTVMLFATLTAAPGQRDGLRAALLDLIGPTRQEPGCLDYVLFEQSDSPGTFIMRESFASAADFEAHTASPHFQGFLAQADGLLSGPVRLTPLTRIPE
ncbi:putative quinol monooxygenase [Novispirillum itersonii]|uniref:Quinol monooxygenase YgiN n=1 Tax=Novispirillum itersonii TaxID=189 RepID=A0A7X0DNB9_NOVIT|nr:putative quinol monooxygenase [Novispirillum itersonii]MBB6211983.1 quinol monooxygenase YgiN [Novispirillum itersonii]